MEFPLYTNDCILFFHNTVPDTYSVHECRISFCSLKAYGNHGTYFEVLDMYGFASKAYSKILTTMIFHKLLKNKMKFSHILSMGLIGIYTYNRIYEKIKDFDVYYFVSPTLLFRNVGYRLMKEGKTVVLGNHGTYFEVLDMYGFASKAYSKILTTMIFHKLLKNRMKFYIHVQNKYQAQYYEKIKCDRSYIREIPYNNVKFNGYKCLDNDNFSVVYLGRLMESKGVDMLLELEKKADINLHIIGKGPYMEKLQQMKNYRYPGIYSH